MGTSNKPKPNNDAASSPTNFFISAKHIRELLAGAVLQGYDPLKILKKASLPSILYTSPGGQVDGMQLQRLIVTITEEMHDSFIGFMEQQPSAGQATTKAPFKVSLPKQTPHETFEEALREAILFSERVSNNTNCNYLIDLKRQECVWSIWYRLRKDVNARLFYWFRLMANYKLFCAMTGKRIKLNRVSFSFPPPAQDEGIDYTIFGCEVLFNQPINALVFDRKYLLLPILHRVEKQLDYQDWFALPGKDESYTKQVEDALTRLQTQNIWFPTIAIVAEELSLKPRALRRQLARENETFLNIKNRVRCELAIKLLVTTDTPIAEIAHQIGFAEPGDFTRAFKDWTQTTPSAYRAEHSQARG